MFCLSDAAPIILVTPTTLGTSTNYSAIETMALLEVELANSTTTSDWQDELPTTTLATVRTNASMIGSRTTP